MKFKILLLIAGISLSSAQGTASEWTFLASSPETKALQAKLEKNQIVEALVTYEQEFAQKSFAQTPTGKALYAYLLVRNGMRVQGLKRFFSINNASQISPQLIAEFKKAIPLGHWAYQQVVIKSPKNWAFFAHPEALVAAQKNWPSMLSAKEMARLASLIPQIKDVNDRAVLSFPVALTATFEKKNALAERMLADLELSGQTVAPADRLALARARLHYQEGRLQEAIKYYKKIGQDSDYWIEALEEQAWASLRVKEPQRSLALLKTATAPVFHSIVGAEPFYLNSYILLKLCDYRGVFRVINDFKSAIKERAGHVQALSKTGQTPEANAALKKFYSGKLSWQDVGSDLKVMPRLFYRDELLMKQIRPVYFRRIESEIAQNLVSMATSQKQKTSWLQAEKAQLVSAAAPQWARVHARLKVLAHAELLETQRNIQKLHVVEAEAIQRLYSYNQSNPNISGEYEDTIKRDANTMVFRANDEIWLDELDNYQVEVKGCATKKEISK